MRIPPFCDTFGAARPMRWIYFLALGLLFCSCSRSRSLTPSNDPSELAEIVKAEIESWRDECRKKIGTQASGGIFPTRRATDAAERLVALKPMSRSVILELIEHYEGQLRTEKLVAKRLGRVHREGVHVVHTDPHVLVVSAIVEWLKLLDRG